MGLTDTARPHGVSILLVDTDGAVRFSVADYLRGHHFEVECAATRPEAEAWLCRRQFDAIVSDLHLGTDGEAGGLDLAERVRLLSPSTFVCLITRPAEPELMVRAERLADAVLLRPRPLADIAQVILAFVARPALPDGR